MTAGPTSLPFAGSPDVVVIGGGIAGATTTAHLAETGRRVVLLERTHLAAGASGRNSGVVQHPFDHVLVALHLETVDLYRRLEIATDGAFRLPAQPVGLLSVTHNVDVARRLADALAMAHPRLEPTFLDPAAARAAEPALGPGVAACRLAIGYPVAPAAATRAYATWARTLGAVVREGAEAQPWVVGDRVRGVRLADGSTILADSVVVAAGPWTPAVVDPSGSWRPIRPLWGVVVSIALDGPPRYVLEEAEIDIEPAGDDAPNGPAFSLVTAEGASSLGSTFLDDEPDASALVDALVARGATFVPAVRHSRRGAIRACARPLSQDGRPLIGRIPWVDGLWVVAGHGPWGISTGPASGRLLADLITGREAGPPPELDPARFGPMPTGRSAV